MTLFSAENDEHWNTGACRLKTAGASFTGCTMHRKVSVQDMCVFETEEFNLFISALHNQWAAADMVNKWIFYR